LIQHLTTISFLIALAKVHVQIMTSVSKTSHYSNGGKCFGNECCCRPVIWLQQLLKGVFVNSVLMTDTKIS